MQQVQSSIMNPPTKQTHETGQRGLVTLLGRATHHLEQAPEIVYLLPIPAIAHFGNQQIYETAVNPELNGLQKRPYNRPAKRISVTIFPELIRRLALAQYVNLLVFALKTF